MPELPEVETIKRGLEDKLKGHIIERATLFYEGMIKAPAPEEFVKGVAGKKVVDVKRRGKYLVIALNDNTVMVFHLRMTGSLEFCMQERVNEKHTHMELALSGSCYLYYADVRKFGTIWWLPSAKLREIKGLAALGPEPLSAAFSYSYLRSKINGHKGNIKALLLNQSFIAGIGNIYADEILFRSTILPSRASVSLTDKETLRLLGNIKEVLNQAIHCRGTTVSDYKDTAGAAGLFQEKLQVYRRRGEPCLRCKEIILREVSAGRGTYYCPSCQQ